MTSVLWATIALALVCASAHQSYQQQIPNGANVVRNGDAWPGVGHLSQYGGGPRNPFGLAFASANHVWTTLCQADSDGDGFSNGAELGDPSCVWTAGATPSRTTGISHPGFADSTPVTTPPSTPNPTAVPTPTPTLAPSPVPTTPNNLEEETTSGTLTGRGVTLSCVALLLFLIALAAA